MVKNHLNSGKESFLFADFGELYLGHHKWRHFILSRTIARRLAIRNTLLNWSKQKLTEFTFCWPMFDTGIRRLHTGQPVYETKDSLFRIPAISHNRQPVGGMRGTHCFYLQKVLIEITVIFVFYNFDLSANKLMENINSVNWVQSIFPNLSSLCVKFVFQSFLFFFQNFMSYVCQSPPFFYPNP